VVDLLAQVADVGLDDVVVAAEVVAPDVVQDLGLGQHPPGVQQQVAQQLELGRGQLDRPPAPLDLVAVLVEGEVGAGQTAGRLGPDPAQDGPDAGHQLLEAERLGDVVVAPDGEPGHGVLGRVAGGEEHDRDTLALGPQPPADVEPVQVGQHHVQHDEVGPEGAGHGDRLVPGPGHGDREALVPERGPDQVGDVRLVVDDEHLRTLGQAVTSW
jgi:hypothetical protein